MVEGQDQSLVLVGFVRRGEVVGLLSEASANTHKGIAFNAYRFSLSNSTRTALTVIHFMSVQCYAVSDFH